MKAVLAKKQQNDYVEEADARSTPENVIKRSFDSVSRKLKKNDSLVHALASRTNCKSTPSLKKRGRPPKAGPSKKLKEMKNVAELYKGKLSNLMRRPRINRSDDTFSDGDWLYW